MTEKFPPPRVTIQRYAASRVCDVVVKVRGQVMVIRCPSYSHALKWARLECKSYNIPVPIDFLDNGESDDDVPLFLRPDRNWNRPGTPIGRFACGRDWRFDGAMPRDPYIREHSPGSARPPKS
jgi:hypothetical protein